MVVNLMNKGGKATGNAQNDSKGKGSGKGKGGGYSQGWYGGGGGDILSQLLGMLGGKGGGKGERYEWKQTFVVDKSGGELGEFIGTIKSFSEWKNYGFITCPELASYGGDVFLHGNMKKGYRQGQTVKFTAVVTKEGKVNAIDLKSGLK
eukprot:TRINITY_DN1189_c0_g2_i2.p2 TRINITY_DN1189_c0_g2~~TRINITY_DN1189_c0_g2_i2.p2  ORF type:complete len:173 (-),score=51.16 TRINITY_DN1189_c0_g2_i2:144-590(-)